MKEQLITFETAKLAKEKGFFYKGMMYRKGGTLSDGKGFMSNLDVYSAPTQSLLQKWLRDVHNIDVWAQPFVRNTSLPDESYSYFLYKDGVWKNDGVDFLDFEEALEKGLQEALKLI
jgi:hypothetical protein